MNDITEILHDELARMKLDHQCNSRAYCAICKHWNKGAQAEYSCMAETIFLCPIVQTQVNIIKGYIQGATPLHDLDWLNVALTTI